MKSVANLTILALLTAAVSSAAQSAPVKDIQAFYDKQNALTIKKDGAGLAKLIKARYTDDFKNISMPDPSGNSATVDRNQTIETMKGAMHSPVSFTKSATHINSATHGSNTIVVNVTTSASAIAANMGDGQSHKIAMTQTGEDTWVKIAGIWKLRKSKSLKAHYTMDGKPVPIN